MLLFPAAIKARCGLVAFPVRGQIHITVDKFFNALWEGKEYTQANPGYRLNAQPLKSELSKAPSISVALALVTRSH